jgi:hypothetical protein
MDLLDATVPHQLILKEDSNTSILALEKLNGFTYHAAMTGKIEELLVHFYLIT